MFEKAKSLAGELYSIWREPSVRLLPAHLAFFVVLSFVPVLIIVFFGAQYFSLPIEILVDPVMVALPEAISTILAPTEEAASGLDVGIWLAVALFVGSNGLNAVMRGSDSLYGFKANNPLSRRLKAICLTLFLVVLVLVGVAIIGFGEYLITALPGNVQEIFGLLRWLLFALLAFMSVKLIYMIAPCRRVSSRFTNTGALFTVIGWLVATLLYTYYYTHFSNYSQIHGILSNIIVLMMLIYILMMVFVTGLVVNVYQYRKHLSEASSNASEENVGGVPDDA